MGEIGPETVVRFRRSVNVVLVDAYLGVFYPEGVVFQGVVRVGGIVVTTYFTIFAYHVGSKVYGADG